MEVDDLTAGCMCVNGGRGRDGRRERVICRGRIWIGQVLRAELIGKVERGGIKATPHGGIASGP